MHQERLFYVQFSHSFYMKLDTVYGTHSIECYRLPRCSAVLFPVVVFISTFISGCWTRKSFGLTLTSDEFKPWITILKQSGFRNSSFGKLGSGYSGNSDTFLVFKTGSGSKISENIAFLFKYLLTILFIEWIYYRYAYSLRWETIKKEIIFFT